MNGRLELTRCLTLNKSWQAISTISVKEALRIVFRGSGRIVDPETYQIFTWEEWVEHRSVAINAAVQEDEYLRTHSYWVRKPEVITLSKFAGYPNKGLPYSRRGVYERDNYQCQFCGLFLTRKNATIDHVVPVSKGGRTEWTNCSCACLKCNNKKAARTPAQAGMPLLNEPFRPTKQQLLLKGVNMLESWKPFLSKDIIEQHIEAPRG